MRLLFLDFDGVLNSEAHFASADFLQATAGRTDAEIMLLDREHHLEPAKLRVLDAIVARTGAEVVISSSWRLRHSLEELNTMLAARGSAVRASAVTPRVTSHDPTRPLRAGEILAYLAELPAPPEAMVALDDDDLGGLVPGHIRTNSSLGLEERHLDECVRALTGGR